MADNHRCNHPRYFVGEERAEYKGASVKDGETSFPRNLVKRETGRYLVFCEDCGEGGVFDIRKAYGFPETFPVEDIKFAWAYSAIAIYRAENLVRS